jgi:hypothetical protein
MGRSHGLRWAGLIPAIDTCRGVKADAGEARVLADSAVRADQLDNSRWRGPTAVPFRSYAATAPSRPANPRTYGPTGRRHHVRRTIISPPTALSDFQVLHRHYVDN